MGADEESQLESLIDELPLGIRQIVLGSRARLRAQFPDAVQVVHPGGGRLAIDFGPDPRPEHVVLRLEASSDDVHLRLLQGDDQRSIAVESPEDLGRDDVAALIQRHLGEVVVLMEASEAGAVVIGEPDS